jgi:CIC family chloride channel protein
MGAPCTAVHADLRTDLKNGSPTTAASIHAPLTAAVLVFELSGDYPIVLPLLLATIVATSISRGLGSKSVYEAELNRKGLGWELTLEGRRLTSIE